MAKETYVYIKKNGDVFVSDTILPSNPKHSLLTVTHAQSNNSPKLRLYLQKPKKLLIKDIPFGKNKALLTSSYDALIYELSSYHGVDANLIKAIARVESAFSPGAVSHAGAQGLMQLMPETAKRYGVKNSFDPVQNITGGILYIKDLFRIFDSRIKFVLAAYNAGEGAVIKYNGIPPYTETQEYVKNVIRFHNMYSSS